MLTYFSKKGTKRNRDAVLLNQQSHKFNQVPVSYAVKAVHKEDCHTVRKTKCKAEKLSEVLS